jgi:probable F420-dependent oxidoreductase
MAGIHIPQNAHVLPDYQYLARRLEADGFDRIWIGELNDVDAVTAATLAALATNHARVGVFLNVFTRAPTTLAMTASTLAHLAPGRAQIVLGVGSPLFVEHWNGISYQRKHARLRDTLHFLRIALSGQRVRNRFPTITGQGFVLASPPQTPPALHVAASGPRALALGAHEADGVVLNWVTAEDLDRVQPLPTTTSAVSLVVPICPTTDRRLVDQTMRPVVASYLNVPAYAQQHRVLGRADSLEPMWRAWAKGDSASARKALPAEIIDEFVVWGSFRHCVARLEEIEQSTGASVIATVFPPPGSAFDDVVLP